jgi:SAM-dependent MidA family methyltransferase
MEPTPLALKIAAGIGDERIPFARFMEQALYDPEGGYYMRRLPPDVRDRDYYTSPDVSETFGRCLARQFTEMWRMLEEPADFHIVELGAGRGLLCGDLLRALEEISPECLSKTSYIAVERSPGRLQDLKDGLNSEKCSWENRVTWKTSIDDVPSGMSGVVFSNELFDAFPVHRICPTKGRLMEVFVSAKGGTFTEELGEPSTPELAAYFDAIEISLVDGDERGRAEVNLMAAQRMEEIGRKLERGFVLTLDYGYPAFELFSPSRVAGGGTLMCYHRHKAHADPYIRVGEQDLTAHVDFSH